MVLRLDPEEIHARAVRYVRIIRNVLQEADAVKKQIPVAQTERIWGPDYNGFRELIANNEYVATTPGVNVRASSVLRAATMLGVHPQSWGNLLDELEAVSEHPDLVPARLTALESEFPQTAKTIHIAAEAHVQKVVETLRDVARQSRIAEGLIATRLGTAQQPVNRFFNRKGGRNSLLHIFEMGEALGFPSNSILDLPVRLNSLALPSPSELQLGLARGFDNVSVRRAMHAARLALASEDLALDLEDVFRGGVDAERAEQQMREFGLVMSNGDVRPIAALAVLLSYRAAMRYPPSVIAEARQTVPLHNSVRGRRRHVAISSNEPHAAPPLPTVGNPLEGQEHAFSDLTMLAEDLFVAEEGKNRSVIPQNVLWNHYFARFRQNPHQTGTATFFRLAAAVGVGPHEWRQLPEALHYVAEHPSGIRRRVEDLCRLWQNPIDAVNDLAVERTALQLQAFNGFIRESGVSYRQIGEYLGLTKTRVSEVVHSGNGTRLWLTLGIGRALGALPNEVFGFPELMERPPQLPPEVVDTFREPHAKWTEQRVRHLLLLSALSEGFRNELTSSLCAPVAPRVAGLRMAGDDYAPIDPVERERLCALAALSYRANEIPIDRKTEALAEYVAYGRDEALFEALNMGGNSHQRSSLGQALEEPYSLDLVLSL